MNNRETINEYFGRSFKIVDWKLIPGNNGVNNPWDDEAPVRQKYWNSFNPGEVVIDVGGCFGLYALPALMQKCRVICLEPNKQFLDLIVESVNMNLGFKDNFIGYNIGAWNGTNFPKELAAGALEWCGKYQNDKFETTTLDELTKNIDRVDMVKIDVEGAELGVLEGSQEMIRKYRPSFLIEDHTGIIDYSTNNKTGQHIILMLDKLNYKIVVGLFGGPEPPGGGRYFIIAIPREKYKEYP